MSASRHKQSAPPFDAIVVVGSQGALNVFRGILESLPAGFPAAIVFDLHRNTRGEFTERLLARSSPLPVRSAVAGLALERGTVYVAPADQQLTVAKRGLLSLTPGLGRPPGHRFADALLSSAAEVFGPRLVAVVLSGRLDGGAEGARVAKAHGARVLVQDPTSAAAVGMPLAALATGCVDFALPPGSLGPALVALCAAAGAADLFRVRLNAGARG